MSFNVIVITSFKKQAKSIAKKHPSLKSDIARLIDSLEENQYKVNLWVKIATKYVWQLPVKIRGKVAVLA